MQSVSQRIKLVRKSKKMNQQVFASIIGVSQTHISKIESNKDNASDKLLRIISEEFDISFEWLKNGTGEMEKSLSTNESLTHDILLNIKKYLSACNLNQSNICSTLINSIPLLINSVGVRDESTQNEVLLELSYLIENVIKLNQYLSNETLNIGESKSIPLKIDEIFTIKENYIKKINTNIDSICNLYLGSGK